MDLRAAAVIDREPGTLARFLVALRRCGFEFADYRFDDESEENSAPRVELRLRGGESAAAADDALRKLPGVVDLQVREYAAPGPDPARLQDPEELAGWLTGLDRVSSLEAAGLVNKRLAELADSTLAPNQRFALLERYGASAMALGGALENRFADWKLPLDPSVQVRVEAGLGLYRALAGAYEQILVAAVSSRQHNGQSAEAAQAARRALEFAFRYFRLTSLSYGCVPDRFWNAVHDVYARARALDIHEDGPVRHVYLKLLLGGLSEPAHFSGSAMHVLFDDAFRRWAAEAQLSERPPKGVRDGLFGVRNDGGVPAMSLGAPGTKGRFDAVLDLRPVVRQLKAEYLALDRNPEVVGEILGDLSLGEKQTVLRGLIRHWGGMVRRAFPRQVHEENFRVVFCLDAVLGLVSGQDQAPDEAKVWTSVDESLAGLQLRAAAPNGGTRIRIGDLVASRPQREKNGWVLGVVRWARRLDDGTIKVGIFKLGSNARRVQTVYRSAQDGERTGPAMVLLPALPGVGRPATLVGAAGTYRSDPALHLKWNGQWAAVQLRSAVRGNRVVEWYEIQDPVVNSIAYTP